MSESDKFWDKAADKYSRSKIPDEESYRKKLVETQKYLNPDMHVLEFGCGTGSTSVHHAPFVKAIDAIDVSENMLNIARRRAREAGVVNISFTRASLIEFSAEGGSVDAVLGLNVLHLISDWQASIHEVARILDKGGVFVSSTACLGHSPVRFLKILTPIGKLLGLMPDFFVLTEAGLVQEIINAGFEIESQWRQDGIESKVFIIARKI